MDSKRIKIFDTTLRDGEQSPGISLNPFEKVEIAEQLSRLGVDVIEAGFPVSSQGDFEGVQKIAGSVSGITVCALARAIENDIDTAWDAIREAEQPRIHTFISTSDVHLEHQLRKSREEVLEIAKKMVALSVGLCEDVEFSAMDATRSDPEFLAAVLQAAIDEGAKTINIPDTVGYAIPGEFGVFIADQFKRTPGLDKVDVSIHCHNDLGLAVGNSLSAVLNGARQVECTINGLGERAGNAALEEVVMSVQTRQDIFPCKTDLDTTQIMTCSRLVSGITGFAVQPNKAIVGANAFAHESGIHQDGVLKSRETYEIMRAQDVGWAANRIVLGKHSGRNAFRTRLKDLDIEFESEEALNEAFSRFKDLADKKHEIFDEDLQALVTDSGLESGNEWLKLVSLRVCSETGETPNASVTLWLNGEEKQAECSGSGPVDAAFKAIEEMVNSGTKLELYSVRAITSGTDSQGEVTVRLKLDGRIVNGQGADTDIVIASAKAYVNAVNKIIQPDARAHPQLGDV